ncbi:transcriptional regulator domain-containing protein [Bradyrhizobium sp. RDT46]|uniref:transcriptional regulator domain-containing protein n=1 Tax=Bradyrhizobium sp. RDT46 TaxID=3341829 RepID=UPI0035C69FF2
MGPDTSRWRSSASYDYVDNLIAPDLAWEWLRRNVDYRRDFADAARSTVDPDQSATLIRDRWGLRFPDRSGPCGTRYFGVLGTRSGPRHGDPRASKDAADD